MDPRDHVIVETDNFGGDYPAEKFVNLPRMTKPHAEEVACAIAAGFSEDYPRYYKVVPMDYLLQPGFEP